MFLNSARLTSPRQNTRKFTKFTATGEHETVRKITSYPNVNCPSKILLQFFYWQNCIRPLSEQCTVRECVIEKSLSAAYI